MQKIHHIKVESGQFKLDGKPFFLFSGEMHYFRMPEDLWKQHLERAKEAGLNAVSTYVPWGWHEYEEGKFDFEGKTHPQRNFIKFLEMAQSVGLYVSARVGPVSNGELTAEGIPTWLLKSHPEIYMQGDALHNLPHAILLSYLNASFLGFVGKWYDRVLPLVSGRQVHCGGPVLMVQLCNEIGMIHWLHKGADRSPNANRMYQAFLEDKYKTVSDLNRAYGTAHIDFSKVAQPEAVLEPEHWNVLFDWALFYRKYYAEYFHALVKMSDNHKITVPRSANAPQFYDYDVRGRGVFSPMTTSLFRDFAKLSPKTVFGGAYQMRRLDFENFHDVAITTEVTRLLDPEAPTICAELQTGIMRDRPRLYPSDVDLNIKTSVAHGLNGVNCYMFSSGRNLAGMGAFGTYHDWQAPVSLDGSVKEHFAPLKEWGRFIRKYGADLAGTKKLNDTAVGLYLPYYATEYMTGSFVRSLESVRTNFFYDGLARLLQLAGYNFEICDLMQMSLEELHKRESLCVFSLDVMDEETQMKLAAYVRRGGKLLIGPNIPSRNLKDAPCTLLAEAMDVVLKESVEKINALWRGDECKLESPVQLVEGGSPLIKSASGMVCAAEGRAEGGQWLSYGFPLSHQFDYHVDMVREWMERLDIRPCVSITPWDVQAVVRAGDKKGFLFLFNYHEVPKKGTAKLLIRNFKLSKTFNLKGRSASVIPFQIKK